MFLNTFQVKKHSTLLLFSPILAVLLDQKRNTMQVIVKGRYIIG